MKIAMNEYIEVNIIGIVLLLTILGYELKNHRKLEDDEEGFFVAMIVINAVILAAGIGITVMQGHYSNMAVLLNHFFCVTYFTLHGWFCYAWTKYVLNKMYTRYRGKAILEGLIMVPAVVSTAAALASPFTGWLYILTADNVYQRGPLIYATVAVPIIYYCMSTAIAAREMRHPGRSRELSEYMVIIMFPLPIFVGSLIELLYYGMSAVWITSAIAILVLFIDKQNQQMSKDGLTGLFNRAHTNTQLAWEIRSLKGADHMLMVMMLDIDDFKSINDKFGHLEGDKALVFAADVLKKNCRRADYVGRYGGDEFLIIGRVYSIKDAELIEQRIQRGIVEANRDSELEVSLAFSIGYEICGPSDSVTMDEILNGADQKMYEVKRGRYLDKSKRGN